MRFFKQFLIFIFIAVALGACSSAPRKTLTPLETLQAYGNAYKKKDITAMKLLLSQESLKMHEQEAKAQNVTVDEIVKRETLFSENQTQADFRNQKIEDDRATIEMKDASGIWNTVQFIKEEGVWKIDRRGFAKKIEQEVEQKQNELDQLINNSRIGNTNENQTKIGNPNENQTDIGNPNVNQPGIGNTNENQTSNGNTNQKP